MAGYDWTPPRQVAVAEVTRRGRRSKPDDSNGRSRSSTSGAQASTSALRGRGESDQQQQQQREQHLSGIDLENVPCRNLAGQILYLSVETTSARVRIGENE